MEDDISGEITLIAVGRGGIGKTFLLRKIERLLGECGYEVDSFADGVFPGLGICAESVKVRRVEGSA